MTKDPQVADRSAESIANALRAQAPHGAAVLIPLVERTDGGWDVVLEMRATTLDIQPGEVCLPGGHIEAGETPVEAAIRETCEELLVSQGSICLIGEMGCMSGPGGMPLWVYVAELRDYRGRYYADEVDHTFTLGLDWLLAHDPTVFDVSLTPTYPDGFPWERIPGGRGYAWRTPRQQVPFYLETEPLVWGATARVLLRSCRILREGGMLTKGGTTS